jgi:hypothetical protein
MDAAYASTREGRYSDLCLNIAGSCKTITQLVGPAVLAALNWLTALARRRLAPGSALHPTAQKLFGHRPGRSVALSLRRPAVALLASRALAMTGMSHRNFSG